MDEFDQFADKPQRYQIKISKFVFFAQKVHYEFVLIFSKGHFQLNKVNSNPYLRMSQPLKLQSSISPKEISIKILLTTSHEQKADFALQRNSQLDN